MSSISKRIRRHLTDQDSPHRRIATSFLWVSLFVFIGKLAGAAKEMTIAWRYGISPTVDAYVFIFNLINWPVSVFFSILTVVLVPLVAKVRGSNSASLPRFRGEILGLTLAVGIGLGVLAYFGFPLLLRTGWAGLKGLALQQALMMAGPLSLLLPLGLTISLFSAWMMACGRHRNTLLEALPALAILVALLLPPCWVPEPLVWGSVAGFALQLAGLGWPLHRVGDLQRPLFGFQSQAWRGFWGSIGIMAIGQTLMSFTGIIDQFFAAHLESGSIATLSYANRIMSLILGLGATAISRSTLPIFSEVAAKNDTNSICRLSMQWGRWMFLLGLGGGAFVWILAPWIVKLLFERGAFTAANTSEVTTILRYFLLQMPFYFYGMVLVAALSSQKKYSALLVTGIIGLCIKPLANLMLLKPLGVSGIALGMSLVYFSTASYMTYIMRRLR